MNPEKKVTPKRVEKIYHALSRAYGLLAISYGIFIASVPLEEGSKETFFDTAGLFVAIYGLSDVVTGEHHYLFQKSVEFFSGNSNKREN